MSVSDEDYSRNVSSAVNSISTFFVTITGFDTSACGLLVHEGIICLVVSASSQAWFIGYMYY